MKDKQYLNNQIKVKINNIYKTVNLNDLAQIAELWQIPYLKQEEIKFCPETVKLASYKLIISKKILPLIVDGNTLVVGTHQFFACDLHQAISFLGYNEIRMVLIDEDTFNQIINKVYGNHISEQIIKNLTIERSLVINHDEIADEILHGPIVQLVSSFINQAINLKASDIHLEPLETKVRLRFRLDGILVEKTSFDLTIYSAIVTRIKIMAGIDITKKRHPQDGRVKISYNEFSYDCRVSTLPTVNGEKIVIRILDRHKFHFKRSELGFNYEDNLKVDEILRAPHGLLLLTGPTGCGKTTTLYSFIQELNNLTRNIVTIEDPVEYTISGVNQVQVHQQINLSFKEAMRSILRQDPDVIMIGEIRDEETAQMAIRAAITGHLVMATLHTNQAPTAITRLTDMGVPVYMIAESLKGIIAQRLVRKVCHYCAYLRPP